MPQTFTSTNFFENVPLICSQILEIEMGKNVIYLLLFGFWGYFPSGDVCVEVNRSHRCPKWKELNTPNLWASSMHRNEICRWIQRLLMVIPSTEWGCQLLSGDFWHFGKCVRTQLNKTKHNHQKHCQFTLITVFSLIYFKNLAKRHLLWSGEGLFFDCLKFKFSFQFFRVSTSLWNLICHNGATLHVT